MKIYQGKKVLITGAASGIGRSLATRMLESGAEVVALDIDEPGLESLQVDTQGLPGIIHKVVCDLASDQEIDRASREVIRILGGLDILVNNAGIGHYSPTHEMTAEQRRRVLQINLNAPFALFHNLVHYLTNSPSGHLVNISSVFGLVPYQRTAAYCASKYGLVGMSEAIRAEYGRQGLGVTMVCPGFVDTPMLKKLPEGTQTGAPLRQPAKWLRTTPDKIARKVMKAIPRNRRLVVATPLAHMLYHFKRLFPGTFDFIQSFSLSRLLRRKRHKNNAESSHSNPADRQKKAA